MGKSKEPTNVEKFIARQLEATKHWPSAKPSDAVKAALGYSVDEIPTAQVDGVKPCPECLGEGAVHVGDEIWYALPCPSCSPEAEIHYLRQTLTHTAASLAAAISLLERGGKAAKKAAPSDRMFDQMIFDYKASLDRARQVVNASAPSTIDTTGAQAQPVGDDRQTAQSSGTAPAPASSGGPHRCEPGG